METSKIFTYISKVPSAFWLQYSAQREAGCHCLAHADAGKSQLSSRCECLPVSNITHFHGCVSDARCVQAAEQVGSTAGVECWQVADASQFMVRGKDYMQTRKKVASRGAIYRSV